MGLSALFRNFCDSCSREQLLSWPPCNARLSHLKTAGAVSFASSARPKTSKNETHVSHGETKRFAFLVLRLKSLCTLNQHFSGLCVFNDLTAFSFRAFLGIPSRP